MTPAASPTVLVVDDDTDTRVMIDVVLSQAGYRTILADDGDEAVRIVAAETVDLAIVDIFMPRQDGIVTIKEIRRQLPHLPVIAMSAGWHVGGDAVWDAAFDVLDDARGAGATEIVRKPFDVTALCSTVRSLLPVC